MSGRTTLPLRRLEAATLVVASVLGALLFAWPLLLGPDSVVPANPATPIGVGLLLALVVAVAVAAATAGTLDARAVATLGVLSAIGAALRPLGTGIAGFEPVFFLLVLAGRALGPAFGFVLGAATLLTSAVVTAGVGPWLPFQMLGAAWVGAGAGLLPRIPERLEPTLLAGYAIVAGLAYGVALNLSFWPTALTGPTATTFVPGDPLGANLRRLAAFTLATSLGFDVPRAVLTAALVLVTGRRLLVTLRRAARRVTLVPDVIGAP